MVLQGFVNSWSTSACFHETPVQPCLFGCSKHRPIRSEFTDSLTHYLECPILWSLVAEATELCVGQSASDRLALSRHPIDLRLLAVAHIMYHHLKFSIGYRMSNDIYFLELEALRSELIIATKVAVAEVLL